MTAHCPTGSVRRTVRQRPLFAHSGRRRMGRNRSPSCLWIALALIRRNGRVAERELYEASVFPLELGCQPHTDHTLGRIVAVVELKIKDRVDVMDASKTRGSEEGARA